MDHVIALRLTDTALDFWVDIRLRRCGGSWLAVSDLASSPEVAVARRLDLAVFLALLPLGSEVATRMASTAPLPT